VTPASRPLAGAVPEPVVRQPRRAYLDWLRGLAVLCMILWHVVDSWHVPGNRDTSTFAAIVFFAGWAAPMFLFLAGVSLPMAGLSRMARGDDRRAAAGALARRGWQVFVIAHLFRLQSFLLNPNASWNSLFKPDILNVLGLGLVCGALVWGRALSTRARVWSLLVPALVIGAVLTPWAPSWWWPSLLHPRLEGYIRIVNGNAVFSLFPAVAYVLAGVFTGTLLAESTRRSEAWFHARGIVVGVALLIVTIGSVAIPMPVEARHWLGPMMIVGLRIGAMLVLMAGAWWLLRGRTLSVSDPMIVLGRTSLFVYWVHVELSYGNFSYPLHKSLSVGWALAGYALMTAGMYAGALWWSRRAAAPLVPAHMAAPAFDPRRPA
jgi:uncharacterized membrane protein